MGAGMTRPSDSSSSSTLSSARPARSLRTSRSGSAVFHALYDYTFTTVYCLVRTMDSTGHLADQRHMMAC